MSPACRLLACQFLILAAWAADGVIDWSAPPAAAGYAEASAAAPAFADAEVWPGTTGRAPYAQQHWDPPSHRYTWAHPGTSAQQNHRRKPLDPWVAGNWIDGTTGKPASEIVWGPTTDFVLPASEQPYEVVWKIQGEEHDPRTFRHLTVHRGARWATSGAKCHGNVWIKHGGGHANHGNFVFAGVAHTFFRNDNGDPTTPQREEGSMVTQYFSHAKDGGSSEILGEAATGDEFRVLTGLMVVGPDSRAQPGRNARPRIEQAATLALLDGAWFGKWCNQINAIDLDLHGTLQGGLPDRPLTRDAFVGISYQNTVGVTFYHSGVIEQKREDLEERNVPLIAYAGSTLRTYSVDPATACLTLTWVGIPAEEWHASGLAFSRSSEASQRHMVQQLAKLPRYVTAAFEPGVVVDGLCFDRFQTGGLLMLRPQEATSWQHVRFGSANQTSPGQLVMRIGTLDSKAGRYEF